MFVLLFVVAPLVELFVAIQVGHAIGGWNTVGLLVLSMIIGIWLIKREGLKVWRRFGEQTRAGNVPSNEIADGVCLLIAGALFVAPGFVSDVLALLLVFPPTRALFRRWMLRRRGWGRVGGTRIIRATYGGPFNGTTVTDTTATEPKGELDP